MGTLALMVLLCLAARAHARETTDSGIPLSAPWQQTIYEFAQSKLKHPAWGWAHSERDYNVALAFGVARQLSTPGDETDFRRPVNSIAKGAENLSSKLLTQAARHLGAQRFKR